MDKRSSPLNQVLAILPKTNIKYIFVENVKGFETSDARTLVTETLTKMNFTWQEFLLNPLQFGVPNSRLRYYLIGKREDLKWGFPINMDNFLTEIPNEAWKGNGLIHNVILKHQRRWEGYRRKRHMANVKEIDEVRHHSIPFIFKTKRQSLKCLKLFSRRGIRNPVQ